MQNYAVWDLLDVFLLEFPNSGFVWVLDPAHGDDDFFTVTNFLYFSDRDHRDRKTPIGKRLITI